MLSFILATAQRHYLVCNEIIHQGFLTESDELKYCIEKTTPLSIDSLKSFQVISALCSYFHNFNILIFMMVSNHTKMFQRTQQMNIAFGCIDLKSSSCTQKLPEQQKI